MFNKFQITKLKMIKDKKDKMEIMSDFESLPLFFTNFNWNLFEFIFIKENIFL